MNEKDLKDLAHEVSQEEAKSRRHWITAWVVIASLIIASTLAWVGVQQRDQIDRLETLVESQKEENAAQAEVLDALHQAQERDACQVLEHRIVATASFRAVLATLKGLASAVATEPRHQRLREFTAAIKLPAAPTPELLRTYRRNCRGQPDYQPLPEINFVPVSTEPQGGSPPRFAVTEPTESEPREPDRDRPPDRDPPQDPKPRDPCDCPDLPDEIEDLFKLLPTPLGGFL